MKTVLPSTNRRPVLGLRRLAVAAGLSVALASGGAAAEAHAAPGLRIDQPVGGAVSGKIPFTARTRGSAVRVRFYVNGRERFLDRAPKWKFGARGVLDTARMRLGNHRLSVYARFRDRSLRGDSVDIRVKSAKAPATNRATWR
ncbi:MAG: hypothetical protein M3088_01810, partial [Actinomycetota bacterium]|nr:hypothetical protein [Actinomycetota bacterium]